MGKLTDAGSLGVARVENRERGRGMCVWMVPHYVMCCLVPIDVKAVDVFAHIRRFMKLCYVPLPDSLGFAFLPF